jgi:serine/threonine protein kinase
LKPDNILLSEDYILKISDFGFSSETLGRNNEGYMKTQLGTKSYMAPEFYKKEKDSEKILPY